MNNVADEMASDTDAKLVMKARRKELPTAKPHDWCRVVRRLRLPSGDRSKKLVAFALATYADAKGKNAAPGERPLAADCALSARRVREGLWWLRENRLVDREGKLGSAAGTPGAADRYRLCLPADWQTRFSLYPECPVVQVIAPRVELGPAAPGSFVARRHRERQSAEPTTVALYRWCDEDDLLLYVGITGDLSGRQDEHAKKSSWADFATHSKVERFPSRADAEVAEVVAIKTEQPLFNHIHNDTPEARARLVAYLLSKGRADLLDPAVSRA